MSVALPASTTSSNLLVVFVVWDNTNAVSLADSSGNSYVSNAMPLTWHGGRYSSQIFYAKNIKGGIATVTGNFSKSITAFGALYVHEYSGLDLLAPFDAAAAAAGSSGSLNSGSVSTSNAKDLLFAAGVSDNNVTAPGAGYTIRGNTNGDLTMDQRVSSAGSYNATAGNSGGAWAMQFVAFKAGGNDGTPPTVPTGLTATAASSSQVNLTWTASSDAVNASSQLSYGVYRNSVRTATTAPGATTWSDTGLLASTTYAYTVSAQDVAGNTSAQSASASATTASVALPAISFFGASPSSVTSGQSTTLSWTVSNATSVTIDQGIGTVTGTSSRSITPAATTVYNLTAANSAGSVTAQTTITVSPIIPTDTQAPTVPANLNPNAVSTSQIELTWSASTDNFGVAGYQVYRNGVRVGVTSATNYSDSGLTAGSTYTYTVAAFDDAGNVSAQSTGAAETTLAIARGNYSTNFPLTESPIFENGMWLNGKANGIDWADVRTTGGLAHGTESGSSDYDDSTALLSGTWGPNQTAQATVYTTNQQTGVIYEEVELRLHSTISAHSNTGYEILFRCVSGGGYVTIVRWNGALGSFTYLNQTGNGNYHGIKTGDVIKASIDSHGLIIGYVNDVEVIRTTDTTYTSGNPGIGFWLEGGSSAYQNDYGFSSFSATDGTTITQPPSNAKVVIDIAK